MKTNVELYEALKDKIGEEGARLIAEVFPAARELATKTDMNNSRTELKEVISQFRAEFKEDINRLERRMGSFETRLAEMETRLLRWTLMFFTPLWIAVLAALVAVIVRT